MLSRNNPFKQLKSYINRQQFDPGLLGVFFNPFYISRNGLKNEIAKFSQDFSGDILDVGCGNKPYRNLFRKANIYDGLEFDSPENRISKSADFFYDGKKFPFDDGVYDGLICNQVLEHVFNPEYFLAEMHRVLKPNGLIMITVPFAWDEHEQPWDYARYTSMGLKFLLEKNGLEVIELRKINSGANAITQLFTGYLYKVFRCRCNLVNLMICAFLLGPINVVGLLISRILPKSDDLYLDQLVIARGVFSDTKLLV